MITFLNNTQYGVESIKLSTKLLNNKGSILKGMNVKIMCIKGENK